MNIWYIHPYAGSPKYGMSFRPYYLARHFNELGYNAIVISSLYHHLCSIPGAKPGVMDVEGVDYFFQKVVSYKGNGLKRVLNMLSFGLGLFSRTFREFSKSNKPDVIIASTAHPFHLLAAKYYAKKYGAKLILEVRDIWPLSLQELVGISKRHPLSIIINIFQKYGYKHCDHCVSLLANAEGFFLEEGLKKDSFTYIPNGIELINEQVTGEVPKALASDLKIALQGFDTVICYAGALGVPNNLMPLIDAAAYLSKHRIGILLVGDGIQKDELKGRVNELNLDNVIFFGKVKKNDVAHVIAQCDALFINAMPKELYKFGMSPNKIFDYMIHDKIVFNGIDSPRNPLEEANCEIKFPANDSLALSEEILRFHNNKNAYKVSSSMFVQEHHTYKKLAKNYILLIEDLVK
ncbi:TPA: glycosyltransferase family 4 protein [Vibrio vulnificus]|uniref:glycosyltransferase family 4 protein n=1 Tax=Vibrio TaxID=662 RepID=UPI000A5D4774|nr:MULTISPECIES: glycosyltransferase family 4 protein [Vibrio]SUP19121.1 glycosyltransferase [Vibrio vulnificus]